MNCFARFLGNLGMFAAVIAGAALFGWTAGLSVQFFGPVGLVVWTAASLVLGAAFVTRLECGK